MQAGADDHVFPMQKGGPMNASNVRKRILDRAVALADQRLTKAGSNPLPQRLSPHKLRHTYTSILAAFGTVPGEMMDELGHTDPGLTFRVYRYAMRRDQASKDRLRVLVGAEVGGAHAEVSGKSSGTNEHNESAAEAVESNAAW